MMMTRFVLTVMLALAVVTASGEAWAKNWNLSDEETAQRMFANLDDKRLCNLAFNSVEQKWRTSSAYRFEVAEARRRGLSCEQELKFSNVSDNIICSRATSKNYDTLSIEWTKHSNRIEFVTEAKRRQLKCRVGSKFITQDKKDTPVNFIVSLKDDVLCRNATAGKKWETAKSWLPYVQEAKRRGLGCGVNETKLSKQTVSNTVTVKGAITNYSDKEVCDTYIEFSKSSGYHGMKYAARTWQNEARRRGLDCGFSNQKSPAEALYDKSSNIFVNYDSKTLCKNIELYGQIDAVQEAKRRGLSCGVGETTQTARPSHQKPNQRSPQPP